MMGTVEARSVTREQLAKAFLLWQQRYDKAPETFYSAEAVARMAEAELEALALQKADYMFGLLEEAA